jgi:succinyl-diaminopimelate desuccinylase
MKDKIILMCEELKDYIAKTTSELVKRRSRNPPGEEKECSEYIYSLLKDEGINAELFYEPYKERPQVIGYVGNKSDKALILNGHIDVVPEGKVELWSFDPFSGIIKDGKVWGRGAADMKGALAVMIALAKIMKEIKFNGNLVLTFAVGEETGLPGTKQILTSYLPKKGIKGEFGIVLEPTELKVATAQRGSIKFEVLVHGKAAHSSRPEQGINAIVKAMEVVNEIQNYVSELSKRKHWILGPPLCSVTMINAGIKDNVIPDVCRMVIDRRTIPGEKIKEIVNEFKNVVDSVKEKDREFSYELNHKLTAEACEIPSDDKYAELLRRISNEIAGIPTKPYGLSGGTDARNFVLDANIPAVAWGPGSIEQAHVTNEFVEIQQLVDALKILAKFTLQFFKTG